MRTSDPCKPPKREPLNGHWDNGMSLYELRTIGQINKRHTIAFKELLQIRCLLTT